MITLAVLSAVLGSAPAPCRVPDSGTPSYHNSAPALSLRGGTDTLSFGRFGSVVVYRKREHPAHVALFVSGDGGWNHGVLQMADALANSDALVVGIDIRRYLNGLRSAKADCWYPAGDFEALSQWVQQRLGFSSYVAPVLVGYSSGATLVYAALAQAPPGTFQAVLSLGFCADLARVGSFCKGNGLVEKVGPKGVLFSPVSRAPAPWIVLQGENDSTCSVVSAAEFVRQVDGAEIVQLARVGHGFAVGSRWTRQFKQSFARLTSAGTRPVRQSAPAVRDLPLVELPSRSGSRTLAVVVSGDGGWASLDRQIGETFAARGIPVVGLNSLQYFWKSKTPEKAAADLTRLLRHYLASWNTSELLLVGYSRGADVLPFMVSRLPPELKARIRIVALLGLGKSAGFEFHFADLIGGAARNELPTAPEVARLRGLPVLCIYGSDERDSGCRGLPSTLATTIAMEGGHHFGGAYKEIAERILRAAGESDQQQRVGPSP